MPVDPPISSLGFIPGAETAALTDSRGTLVWYCHPRIDAPSLFGALLDPEAGSWSVAPVGVWEPEQAYTDASLVLVTSWRDAAGTTGVTVTDWFEPSTSRLCRRIDALVDVTVEADVAPRPDYARRQPELHQTAEGLAIAADGTREVRLHWDTAPDERRVGGGTAHLRWDLTSGTSVVLTLGDGAGAVATPDAALDDWRAWSARLRPVGDLTAPAHHAARVLRGLVHAPTGAIVAAPTTSLPEDPGGERNWDYRYCWLRDSAYMLEALVALGSVTEAEAFLGWFARTAGDDPAGLRPLYRVDGGTDVEEEELDHLRGYAGSRPVRIGNGAAGQVQLDVYAAAIDLQYAVATAGGRRDVLAWPLVQALVAAVRERWSAPDAGLWEIRSAPRHHTFSKFQCWLAVDRAVRLAELRGEAAPADWQPLAAEIRDTVLRDGVGQDRALRQAFGGERTDASLLLLPLKGLIDVDDPITTATLALVRDELDEGGGLLVRYRNEDGLKGDDGVFVLCTFWLAELLARRGEHASARAIIDRVLGAAGPLGLLSEELDRTGRVQLGNTPQGFSHTGLIRAALALAERG